MRLLFILSMFFAFAWNTQAQNFSKEQIQADVNFMIEKMKTYNPGLYRFNPDFDKKVDGLKKSIREEMPILEYFALIAQISALANEGHVNLGNWGDTVHNGFKTRYTYMPFSVKVIGNRVFVWKDYSNEHQFQKGDEIHSINGRSISSILEKIRSCLASDGHIVSYLNHQITFGFPWMYYLYIEQTPNFHIIYEKQGIASENSAMVKAILQNDMRTNFSKYYGKEAKADSDSTNGVFNIYHNERHHYTYVTLKSFNRQRLEQNDIKAKNFYKELFRDLQAKGTKKLVFDLRNNNGGRKEMAYEIIPFLLKKKMSGPYKTSVSFKGKVKEYKYPKPSKYSFNGQIYVLVNGQSFSAASSLARFLKEHGNAIVIGEEGGGRYEGFVAGSREFVSLPNSKIELGIPRYLNYFDASEKQKTTNRGILPDIRIKMTIEDYINNRDPYYEKVLELLTQ